MEKHDLITLMSPNYCKFGNLFIASCIESGCIDNFENIYIYYTGEKSPRLDMYGYLDKVKFLSTEKSIASSILHDSGWRKITNNKTSILHSHLLEHCTNTVLMDIDSYFISNFADLLTESFDIAVCKRDQSQNHGYIGSFFIANYADKALSFISEWIDEIYQLKDKYVESKALGNILLHASDKIIIEYPESIVSALNRTDKTRILHLKSRPGYETVEERLSLINNSNNVTNV